MVCWFSSHVLILKMVWIQISDNFKRSVHLALSDVSIPHLHIVVCMQFGSVANRGQPTLLMGVLKETQVGHNMKEIEIT